MSMEVTFDTIASSCFLAAKVFKYCGLDIIAASVNCIMLQKNPSLYLDYYKTYTLNNLDNSVCLLQVDGTKFEGYSGDQSVCSLSFRVKRL